MRATGVMRFVIFGAVGFGIGGTIAGVSWPLAPLTSGASGLLFVLSGAVGGASLGLALGDRRKTMRLAVLGVLGSTIGGIVALLTAFGFFAPIPALSGSVDYGVRGVMGLLGERWSEGRWVWPSEMDEGSPPLLWPAPWGSVQELSSEPFVFEGSSERTSWWGY